MFTFIHTKRITRSSRICTKKLVLNRYKIFTSFSYQTGLNFWMEFVWIGSISIGPWDEGSTSTKKT